MSCKERIKSERQSNRKGGRTEGLAKILRATFRLSALAVKIVFTPG
jgi:hypothetical protein